MSRCVRPFLAALALVAWLLPLSASASVIEATATPFAGADLLVSISVDDGVDPGNLEITLTVEGGDIGDLRGLFLHVSDESLLAGLSASGFDVTSAEFAANGVTHVGGGNTLNGGGSPCACDIGIEFGSPGMGSNDLQTVTFILSHATEDLDVSLLEEQLFGIRATSVGPIDGRREGSSKLSGVLPVVPEPSTALLMVLGLIGLSTAGERIRR